jgi:predicted kinase
MTDSEVSTSSRRIQLPKTSLVLLMGVAGSGKTTLARLLLRRIVLTYLDNNFLADAFFPDTRTSRAYMRVRPRLYEILYRITEENLSVGNSVLIDAPHVTQMQDEQWRRTMLSLAQRASAQLIIVRCRTDEETLRNRLTVRGERRDDDKLGDLAAFLRREPIDADIPLEHLDVDTTREPPIDLADRAIRYILSRSE